MSEVDETPYIPVTYSFECQRECKFKQYETQFASLLQSFMFAHCYLYISDGDRLWKMLNFLIQYFSKKAISSQRV